MGQQDTGLAGRAAEDRAVHYLTHQGLLPLARNFRCRGGEIDVIMLHDQCLVFVEVRYRGERSFAPAIHTVDQTKQRKLIRTAALFIARRRGHANRTMRFDVVGLDGSGDADITWIRDAFRPNNSSC